MQVRNRKTNQSFDVAPDHSLIALKTQSVFKKQTDYSVLEEFLQHFKSMLPNNMAPNEKEKMVKKLRQTCKQSKEIIQMINHPNTISNLMNEAAKQMIAAEKQQTDSTSTAAFLKLLGTKLISAKLDAIFPGFSLLTLLASATPGAAKSIYTYFEGQPVGGENLCPPEQAFQDCIQGYLTEMDKEWKNDMPQVARIFEPLNGNETGTCMTQSDLKAMMLRAYRGPTETAANCTLDEIAANGDVMVKATNVDTITCNIMQDSLVGFTEKCHNVPPSPPAPAPSPVDMKLLATYVGGSVAGACLLAFLIYSIHKCVKNNRQQAGLAHENPANYGTIKV